MILSNITKKSELSLHPPLCVRQCGRNRDVHAGEGACVCGCVAACVYCVQTLACIMSYF